MAFILQNDSEGLQKTIFKTFGLLGETEYMTELELLKRINEKKRILIYGAGMVGGLVLSRLKALGIDDKSLAFVITNASSNQYYMDHKVYGIDDYEPHDQCLIIVSTLPKNHGQMVQELKKRNIDNYIIVDDELYEDMERNYISEYKTLHDQIEGDRDVLLMSSDNNYTSGAFLCMVDLCLGMMDRGIKPIVVLPGYGNAEQMLKEHHIEYVFVQSRSGLGDIDEDSEEPTMDSVTIQDIEMLINKYHIKLVHLNSMHTYVGAVAAQETGVPYIWHIRENIKEQGLRFIDEDERYRLINSSARIITVSDYVGSCYPRLDQSRVVCIYDGVDTRKYYSERDILNGDTIKILMPGIMVPLKGQLQLIKAAEGLKKSDIRFDISLVGSGDADYIKTIEKEIDQFDLKDMVHINGRVRNLEEWYWDSDIVVVCSRSEAFGRVAVEAQSAGCVVIGADCGATTELIRDGVTGYLYELDNVKMLKNRIMMVCNDKEQANRIAKQGQKQVLEKFDKSMNCEKVIREYKRILGDKLCG